MEMSLLGPAAVAVSGGVGADEVHRLHEHARRAAAGVVDASAVGLQHLHQQPDDGARGVELAALPSLQKGELPQEVLVDPAQHIGGPRLGPADLDVADEVDDLPQPLLVQRLPGVVRGQHIPQRRVLPLHGGHGRVHGLADGGLARVGLDVGPASIGGHPEDVLGAVLVRVLRVGALVTFGLQLGVGLLEGVGDVLEEDQAQDDVLVLGGVHAAAQGVGHPPQIGLVACGGATRSGVPAGGRSSPWCRRHYPSPPRLPLERHLSTSRMAFLPPGP